MPTLYVISGASCKVFGLPAIDISDVLGAWTSFSKRVTWLLPMNRIQN